MQDMDVELRSELQALRARAYGPDADLDRDPAAVARLQELEDLERQARVEAAVRPPVTPPMAPDAAPLVVDDDDVEGGVPTVSRPVVRRARTLWLWAGSLAAVAAVASAASIAATTFVPVARTAGVAQVDTLRVDPSADDSPVRSMGFDSSEVSVYADFHGLTAYAGTTQVDSSGTRAECLILLDTSTLPASGDINASQIGYRYGGCGAGAFPATIEFVVTPDLPDAFRERFPVGSSLQFVSDRDHVGVFSDVE